MQNLSTTIEIWFNCGWTLRVFGFGCSQLVGRFNLQCTWMHYLRITKFIVWINENILFVNVNGEHLPFWMPNKPTDRSTVQPYVLDIEQKMLWIVQLLQASNFALNTENICSKSFVEWMYASIFAYMPYTPISRTICLSREK